VYAFGTLCCVFGMGKCIIRGTLLTMTRQRWQSFLVLELNYYIIFEIVGHLFITACLFAHHRSTS